jgi:beta-lactam-binding protein with PASTA domain
MGRVYLARDAALKVPREKYAWTEEFVGRFEREAKAASLNHSHVSGYEVAGTRSRPSADLVVTGTDPPAGTSIASGSRVTLMLSGAPPEDAPSGDVAQPSSTASPSSEEDDMEEAGEAEKEDE